MMTGYEQGGENPKVAERTKVLAAEFGEAVAEWWRKELSSHLEVISREQLEEIVDARRIVAEFNFAHERDTGKHNDIHSVSPGLRAILTSGGKHHIEMAARTREALDRLSSPTFTPVSNAAGDELYAMDLPTGMFEESETPGPYKLMFNTETREVRGQLQPGGLGLRALPSSVVRIEGSAGELWQNPAFLPDGQRRTTQAEVRNT